MDRRVHNIEVAIRHLQEPKITRIITETAETVPVSPAAGWTFIARTGCKHPQKYVDRATRLLELFQGRSFEQMDSAWVLSSVAAYSHGLLPYFVPHPDELLARCWDDELEERLRLKFA